MNDIEVLVALAMAVGVAGTLIPIVPGLVLVWGAALVFGLSEGFGTGGAIAMVILTLLLIASVVLSFVIPQQKAAGSGASIWGQGGAVVGAVVGFFAIPVVGAIAGAPLGALAFEWFHQKDFTKAKVATRGLLVGMGWSTLVNFVFGMTMVGIWVVWAFF